MIMTIVIRYLPWCLLWLLLGMLAALILPYRGKKEVMVAMLGPISFVYMLYRVRKQMVRTKREYER